MRLTFLYPNGNYYIHFDASQTKAYNKLGQLEDIEERLSKYKEIGISGLIDLFNNLTDEDIEYIVQLSFKKRKIVYDIKLEQQYKKELYERNKARFEGRANAIRNINKQRRH